MSSLAALHRLGPLPLLRVGRRALLARAASRSCAGETAALPVPPCTPHARPACRRPPPPCANASRAVQIVCCAPHRGRRPPCDPRAAPKPLSCTTARSVAERALVAWSEGDADCGTGQDRVARRLAANDVARRRHYELEARERTAAFCLKPPSLEPCARRQHARCGLGQQAPPPEAVPRTPDSTCHGPARPDACAPPPFAPSAAPPAPPRAKPCARRQHARYGLGQQAPLPEAVPRTPDATCHGPARPDVCAPQLPPSAPSAAPSAPPRAEPCASGPAAATAAPRGLAERIVAGLRGQPTPAASLDSRTPPTRCLHTQSGRVTPESQLERALRSRNALQAAGRGRETLLCAERPRAMPPPPPAGRLELPVPAGAARIQVLVTLSARSEGSVEGVEGAGCAMPARSKPPPAGRRDSWLSIRTIQKKLSGCGCDAPPSLPRPARPTVNPVCPPCPATPAPTPPKCAHPQKPRPSPCDRQGLGPKL